MGYEIMDPHPSKGYMATLSTRRDQTLARLAVMLEVAEDARATSAAVLAEIRFREFGVQEPVYIRGKWMVVEGCKWVERDAPAYAPEQTRRRRS